MAYRYLQPQQRTIELTAATYAFGYAVFIGIVSTFGDRGPLEWTGWPLHGQLFIAAVMAASGLLHALGVRVNGGWRWSPALRAVAMVLHFTAIASIDLRAPIMSTAFFNYSAIGLLLFIGTLNAFHDLSHAWGAVHGKPAVT